MTVNTKAMVGVPVETRAGNALGKVASFDLDALTGKMTTLRVKTRGFVSGLMEDELMIDWDAVIELTPERVVIADAAVKVGAKVLAQAKPFSSPSLMKEG